jgi:hypothetical protein
LYLALKPAQRIFERLAFLNANLSQVNTPPNLPDGFSYHSGVRAVRPINLFT